MTASLRIAGRVHDSIVDGPGLRYVVFTQGCPLRCSGCHNPSARSFAAGRDVTVAELIADLDSNPLITGLTLSGGEPTMQAGACAELARAARDRGLSTWCYSGFRMERLLTRCASEPDLLSLLQHLDVLVDGPYLKVKRTLTLPWRGSRNQRLIDVPATLSSGHVVEWVDA